MAFSSAETTRSTPLLLKVICKCGHTGIVSAESLPRELRCWRCGTARHVEARHGRRVASRDAALEMLAGGEARPARGAVEGRSHQHQK
jgi:hypothetical protein